MICVKGNTIQMTRGDTLSVQVGIMQDGEPYVPAAGDTITFALKSQKMAPGGTNYIDATPLLSKTIPNETLLLTLDPNDTDGLDFGTYTFDISIMFEDGSVDTFITASDFIIGPEVHSSEVVTHDG